MTTERPFPPDPIAAVTHPDPYPFYAALVAERPLYRDEALGLWVAASAKAVTAVLTSDLCRVRPPAEPVPRALLGSPAGEIFRHLVRMNDGPGHGPCKHAVGATLGSLDEAEAAAVSRLWARCLADELLPADDPGLAGFHFRLPVYVLASLLGLPPEELRQTALWAGDFATALAPASTPGQIERGKAAAGFLLEQFRALRLNGSAAGLLAALAREAQGLGSRGRDGEDLIVANAIGWFFQAHDATAGLIGNALVALGMDPDVRQRVSTDPDLLSAVLLEVLRYDPPIQNTRRFVAQDGVVAGQRMREGDAVLVLLAAANRDPAAHPSPERLDPCRQERGSLIFGAGAHACPGQALAVTIARAGVERLILAGLDLERLAATVIYRPSANARIPVRLGSLMG